MTSLRRARLGACWGLAACCHAAGPDWLRSALAANNPPWAPEAAAVQLFDSSQVRYLSAQHSVIVFRGAIRVASEAGLAKAAVAYPYNADTDRILSARAWVVAPDGKKTQTFQQAAFVDRVAQFNQYFWDSERVLQFVGAGRTEIGGVLAWEIQCDQQRGIEDSSATFLPALPTARSLYEVIPAPGTRLDWRAHTPGLLPGPGSEPGALRWELDREREITSGEPSGFIPDLRRVSVRCVSAAPAAGQEVPTWGALSRIIAQITDPRIDPAGQVKVQAEALAREKPERWLRIRALTEFVQREIAYLAITLDKDTLAGYRPHPAADVLRNRYGDCKDKATLLVSLLRAIGEDGRLVLVENGDPKFVDPKWPSAEFNHAIVAIPAGTDCPAWWPVVDSGPLGKLVIFDPTDSETPLGVLSREDQAGFALIVDRAGGTLVQLPASDPEHSGLERKVDATLDAQGVLAVHIEENRVGLAAAAAHRTRSDLPRDQYQAFLDRRMQQGHALAQNLTWSDHWRADEAKFGLQMALTIPDYAHSLGNGLTLLDPNILPDPILLRPWTVRNPGVVWLEPESVIEEARFTLPPGTAVEDLPDTYSEEGRNVSAQLSYAKEGDAVVYRRRIVRQAGFYELKDYDDLRAFYRRLSEAERQPVVLRQANPS
jgi:hypothetical protein